MQGFPAGHGRSGSAAPTASTGRYKYTQTHMAYIQDEPMHQEPRREDTEIVA